MGKRDMDPASGDAASYPSEGIRTFVSFLLIVHISAVVVGWLASNSMGRSFVVAGAAEKFFRPYLQVFWLGTSYEYNHMNGQRSQIGAVARSQVTKPTVENPPTAYPIPEKLLDRSDRQQRYFQRLLNDAVLPRGEDLPEEANANRLFEFVGARILHETGATDVKLRIFRPTEDVTDAKNFFRTEPSGRDVYNPRNDEPGGYILDAPIQMQVIPNGPPTFSRLAGKMQSAPAAKAPASPAPPAASSGKDKPSDSPLKSTKPGPAPSEAPSP